MKQRFGFTLIELMVAIAIIAVVAMVGLASYLASQRRARDTRRRADVKAMQNGFEQYYAINNGYSDCTTMFSDESIFPTQKKPNDPKPGWEYVCDTNDSNYDYCICAQLEDTTAGNSDANCGFGNATTNFCVKNFQ